ncbi:hypothetical protein [Bifidobacterium sp. B4001]|uniref:hypothetical protein n=1 Tax=Bifidobacterium sp. B4001 TaxID=2817961 RepID=UPI00226B2702|nr:hypothetical protein [Bifidobacterium sp. B4001]MCX8672429.1 hypothetical protein [Bifidobacterium sp. B4079]
MAGMTRDYPAELDTAVTGYLLLSVRPDTSARFEQISKASKAYMDMPVGIY